MFGKKKVDNQRKSEGGKALMAQLGFMTNIDDMVMGSPDCDDDLEAELRALQGEDCRQDSLSNKKAKLKSPAELDKMIALSMRDIGSDEDVSDTDDPELMAELETLMSDEEDSAEPSPKKSIIATTSSNSNSNVTQLLQERINNYNSAITNCGDSSKIRRYERGVKILENLLKQAKMGGAVSESDIPPPLVVSVAASQNVASIEVPLKQTQDSSQINLSSRQILKQPPQQGYPKKVEETASPLVNVPATVVSPGKQQDAQKNSEKLKKLINEKELFKSEALKMKQMGNNAKAVELLKAYKQYDSAVKTIEEGFDVDEKTLPSFSGILSPEKARPEPPDASCNLKGKVLSQAPLDKIKKGENTMETSSSSSPPSTSSSSSSSGSPLDELQLRMNKYKEAEQQANAENNSSKARRMGRIVKQYEEAIKMIRKGQPCNLSELPNPPGFPPLEKSEPPEAAPRPSSPPVQTNVEEAKLPTPTKTPPGPVPLQRQPSSAYSRAEQQASFLMNRQLQFKKAAIQAKGSGDLELAKKYMRMAKGFDQMIEASKSGLPVDLAQVPRPPAEESGFVFVQSSDISSAISGDSKDVYKNLQDDLIKQIKLSEANRDMFTKLGDISSANKFEKLRESTSKDLESLKNAFEHDDPVPRFHYETRQFSVVRCCPDLGDNDLELSIIRGLNFNSPPGFNPSDLHTYVKFEFPFSDTVQAGETSVVKGTDSPEFNFTIKLEVMRKSRSFLRLIKSSKTLKLDVYYRRGFLKSDKILGSVAVKLQPLEDVCTYHESLDLTEGRKAVGGKLEIKIRIRDPFVNKQVDETKEKWLVIDDFVRKPAPPPPPPAMKSAASKQVQKATPPNSNVCISVLMYERDTLDQQITKYKNKLKPAELEALKNKGSMLERTAGQLKTQLQTGGTKAMQDYLSKLMVLSQAYAAQVKDHAIHNSADKIKIALTKKSLVDKEIESVSRRLQKK